jgi:hypothetical protein
VFAKPSSICALSNRICACPKPLERLSKTGFQGPKTPLISEAIKSGIARETSLTLRQATVSNQADALPGGAVGDLSAVPSPLGSAPLVCSKNFFASLCFCNATGLYAPNVVKLRTSVQVSLRPFATLKENLPASCRLARACLVAANSFRTW